MHKMDKLLTTTPNPVDRLAQFSDRSFEIAPAPSGVMPWTCDRTNYKQLVVLATGLSDSKESAWVAATYCYIAPVSFVESDPESGRLFLSLDEAAFIRLVQKDLDDMPVSVRSSHPAELCRRFAEGVGMALAYVPLARCAVFGDEEDGVTLVAHSRASMRQVSFEFRPDQDSIHIISIDEEMRRYERPCGITKVQILSQVIAWLNPF